MLLLTALVIYLLYFTVTPHFTRSHDLMGHIPYVEHIVKHNSLPANSVCVQCYQPSLYYISAALIYKAALLLGITEYYHIYAILQFFSLVMFFAFRRNRMV